MVKNTYEQDFFEVEINETDLFNQIEGSTHDEPKSSLASPARSEPGKF
jgi:hypothetical protein